VTQDIATGMMALTKIPLTLCIFFLLSISVTKAFNVILNEKRSLLVPTRSHTSTSILRTPTVAKIQAHRHHPTPPLHQSSKDEGEKDKGLSIENILQPWKVDIPDEYRNKLMTAEANTPAGKERKQRMNFFISGTLAGFVISSANIYLTTIREYENASSFADDVIFLNEQGYDWVTSNPVLSFFLLNGIGGGLGLLLFGACGTMVELEQRTKSESAQKIWDELVRRRESTEGKGKAAKKRNKQKKRAKQRKRMEALSEVIGETTIVGDDNSAVAEAESSVDTATTTVVKEEEKKGGGILDKMKGFYDQADSMAASQALLLNKKLEDEGLIDKITDESGFRVIGKEAASKLQEEKDKKED